MNRRRYLVVDDNQMFADNLAEILVDAGADATVATSGEAALTLVRSHQFDALVTDLRMPVMHGAKLVHRIHRIDPGLPAIVVTGYTADNDLEAARREGLLAVLPKPVPVPRLIDILDHARRDGVVAVIEYDLALADDLGEALRDRGFTAVTACSVVDTERLGVRPFCGVVDLQSPGGAAEEDTLRRLAARFAALPIFVIAGRSEASAQLDEPVFKQRFDTEELMSILDKIHGIAAGPAPAFA
jgi:CheY-like chemotaxis protein